MKLKLLLIPDQSPVHAAVTDQRHYDQVRIRMRFLTSKLQSEKPEDNIIGVIYITIYCVVRHFSLSYQKN
jgi:hypothetical protein